MNRSEKTKVLPFQDCFEYASPEQSKGAGKPNPWRTLAVPKIAVRLGAPRAFDRCELSAFAASSAGRARRKALFPHVGSGRERGRGFDAAGFQPKKYTGQMPCVFFGRSDGIRRPKAQLNCVKSKVYLP